MKTPSFPTAINPDVNLQFAGFSNYQDQLAEVAQALTDAKVAVYPLDPSGWQTPAVFQAQYQMRGDPRGGNGIRGQHSIGQQFQLEAQSRFDRKQSMNELAEQTGGLSVSRTMISTIVCGKPVNDGSSFYEIA